ncbi:4068_t:CDS:1 [Ambispora leptoticha]|uniref:4068_t:CDS:1 n=1 Tax=Ambispora leptoticha TaxID=144679 RepID=A0A9N9FVT9_9GLOM|nr:4068_t:CDS:1 [Ambispora leptoticha]
MFAYTTSQLINLVKNDFFSIITLTIVIYVIHYYISYFNRTSKVPGPFPLPLIGNIHQIGADFPAATERFQKKYGDFYEFYMGNKRNIVISRPDLVEKVWGPLSLKNTKFIMRNAYSVGIDELGLGTKGMVLNRNIESWSLNRKLLVPSISSPSFLRESIKLSSKVINEMFEYWKIMEKEGMQVELSDWMDALGADNVVKTATGKKMSATAELFNSLHGNGKKSRMQGTWENGVKLIQAIHTYNESMIFMMLLPTFFRRNFPGIKALNKKFLDNKDWINNELEKIVAERRNEIKNTPLDQPLEPNILTLLLTTNTERDSGKIAVGKLDRSLTDEEISSIIREVFTGGLDTTANTLSFIGFYIAKHRDVYLKMREEILNVYGTLDNPDLTFESYEKLKYIEAVIYEGIRIFPTVQTIPRTAIEDVEFDGLTIKADTTVYTDLKALSNNPKYFKDSENFNPDRFLVDKESMVKYTYLPFGNGVRICPGRAWAIVQMKTFLVKLVCTFDIESTDKNSSPKYVYATAKRPVDIKLYIKTRKN